MYTRLKFLSLIFWFYANSGFSQIWSYDFGTGKNASFTSNNSFSTTFLPQPDPGAGQDLVYVSTEGGGLYLENQTIQFGKDRYLMIGSSQNSSINKFSIYDYTPGKTFALTFRIRFGNWDGTSVAFSSNFRLCVGDGDSYSLGYYPAMLTQTFTCLSWELKGNNTITTKFINRNTALTIHGTPFSQGNDYIVDIIGNNTKNTIYYKDGRQSVPANTFDLWVNGIKVGQDLPKSRLADDSYIDSFTFDGERSTGNVANIFLDDIKYSNTADNFLPVELASFTAKATAGKITLNVFNSLGQKVETLLNGEVHSGYHEVNFDASGLPGGVYFYELNTGGFREA
ncbi:MAG: hypothetical protein QY308_04900 [Ignavibacteriaceae bacterium]|nr:MAG: hypothetical protein QY308_04900 [Ignavibacteriaceae bacterium]